MCTFADVNAEDKLQLALIRIAQLEDELKAQASRPDWTAREKELNERHARELYEQKMFFKGLMEEQKESHRVDMENLKKSLHEESERNIQRLEESHKREMDALRAQQAIHEDFQNRHIDFLNKGMAELKDLLQASQLSEEEAKAMAQWRQRQAWRRSSEQRAYLNGRQPKNRQEQKDHMCDDSDDDIGYVLIICCQVLPPILTRSRRMVRRARAAVPTTQRTNHIQLPPPISSWAITTLCLLVGVL